MELWRATSRDRRDEIAGCRVSAALEWPWPPPKETAARGKLGGREKTVPGGSGRSKHSTRRDGQDYRPYVVVVRLWNRFNEYGKYATYAEANAEVAKLKKLEFRAKWVAR
jgi:hypothetical protein